MQTYWISPNNVEHLLLNGRCATCGNAHPATEVEVYSTNRDQPGFDWYSVQSALETEDEE